MSRPTFSEVGRPITASDIAAVEQALGVRFPPEYIAFLSSTNGGRPSPDSFAGESEWGGSLLDYFLQVDGGEWDDLIQVNERMEPPTGLVAVALDAGNNGVCLAIDEPRRGEIYFWPRDTDEPPFKIAASLEDFLSTFHDPQPRAPVPPKVPRARSLDACRADLERGAAVLRKHERDEAEEDRVMDALLVQAASAAAAIRMRAGAGDHTELLDAIRRLGEHNASHRKHREPPLVLAPIADVAEFAAQDDALMRAITRHHTRAVGAEKRVGEVLDVLARARRTLVALGEAEDGARVTALDSACNQAREWLLRKDALAGGGGPGG